MATRSLPLAGRLLCLALDTSARFAVDCDSASRTFNASRPDRRTVRPVPRFRRLAVDQSRRLLRHLGRRCGGLRIHVLRPSGVGPSEPRTIVTASDPDWLQVPADTLVRLLLDKRSAA